MKKIVGVACYLDKYLVSRQLLNGFRTFFSLLYNNFYLIKKIPQNTFARTFLTLIILAIGGVSY